MIHTFTGTENYIATDELQTAVNAAIALEKLRDGDALCPFSANFDEPFGGGPFRGAERNARVEAPDRLAHHCRVDRVGNEDNAVGPVGERLSGQDREERFLARRKWQRR